MTAQEKASSIAIGFDCGGDCEDAADCQYAGCRALRNDIETEMALADNLASVVLDMLSGIAYLRVHSAVPAGFGADRLDDTGHQAIEKWQRARR